MFGMTPDQHSTGRSHGIRNEEIIVGKSIILDFSTLLPTAAQIETFNHPSTGNTPIKSPKCSEKAYSTITLTASLPRQRPSSQQTKPVEWLDSLFSSANPMRSLQSEDFSWWKQSLNGSSHEECCDALLHAAWCIRIAKEQLTELYLKSPEDSFSSLNDVFADRAEAKGLLTGMPLSAVPWNMVSEDMVSRISTMVLKSSILQAGEALYRIVTEILSVQSQVNKILRPSSGLPENPWGSKEYDDEEQDLELQLNALVKEKAQELSVAVCCPIEGKYKSAANRDYVLRLSAKEREVVLAERKKAAVRVEQDFRLHAQLWSSEPWNRKRDRRAAFANHDVSLEEADTWSALSSPQRKRRMLAKPLCARGDLKRKRDWQDGFGFDVMLTGEVDALSVPSSSPSKRRRCEADVSFI